MDGTTIPSNLALLAKSTRETNGTPFYRDISWQNNRLTFSKKFKLEPIVVKVYHWLAELLETGPA